jgi:hypothetical protein
MLSLAGLDLHKYNEISDSIILTLQEYVAYIALSTSTMKSKANRIDNDYKKYNSHMSFPSHSDLTTPDEFEEALRRSGELDDKFRYRLSLYRHFYAHREHKDVSAWHRRYEWLNREEN